MFNESQQRHLLSRLRDIDERLSEALARLEPVDPGSLFRPVVPDASPAERRILADFLAQVRFALRRFTLTQQLTDSYRPPGGLKSLRTAVVFAEIAAEELRPRYWRGYGEVDPGSAAAAERFAADLTALLRRMEGYVAHGKGGGVAARLGQLSGARDEIALLTHLERIIAAHGLAELRTPLEVLVDRAARPRFEIAVFGRVSAGKSSLLNWWLGQPWLPTGITPVTAVPTYIEHGDTARAHIERARGPPIDIPAAEVAPYITEQGHRGAAERIVSVRIEAPSERLEGGIRLVDTPGLGSVATAGVARTLEYLPQCDLGILLMEAGAPVAPDDLDVARALLHGGSEALLVLSKADRLGGPELEQSVAYVKSVFESELSTTFDVRPVSVAAGHTALAERWFEELLAPRLASHAETAAEALKRKTAVLKESVAALLEIRLRKSPEDLAPDTAAPAHERIAQVRADLERVRSELLDLRPRAAHLADALAECAAQTLARSWSEAIRGESSLLERVERAIARRADEVGHTVARMLDELRVEMAQIIEQCGLRREGPRKLGAEGARREADLELPEPRGRPVFDTEAALAARPRCAPPRWLPVGFLLARPIARLRVRRVMLAPLQGELRLYGEALQRWGATYLHDLQQRFDAAVAIAEGLARAGADGAMTGAAAQAARCDLERLRQWPASAA
ncbi:MAG: dynamin family protein [Steroidobacteraceae bacterium]